MLDTNIVVFIWEFNNRMVDMPHYLHTCQLVMSTFPLCDQGTYT